MDNSWAPSTPIFADADSTILVVVALSGGGAPDFHNVLGDNAGNSYHADLYVWTPHPALTTSLCVFRAKNTAEGYRFFTVQWPGQHSNATLWAINVKGLKNESPVAVGQHGYESDHPTFSVNVAGQESLVLAGFSNFRIDAVSVIPTGFTNLGSVMSFVNPAGGNACYRVFDKAQKHVPIAWGYSSVATAPWSAGVLTYKAEPKVRPKPTGKPCGLKPWWQEGVTEGNAIITDKYGFSPCCGTQYPFFLGCVHLSDTLVIRITSIRDKSPNTISEVGMEFTLEFDHVESWGGSQTWYPAEGIFFGTLVLRCLSDVLYVSSSDNEGAGLAATNQRMTPPGATWSGFFPMGVFNPPEDQAENWDLLLLTPPALKPYWPRS